MIVWNTFWKTIISGRQELFCNFRDIFFCWNEMFAN